MSDLSEASASLNAERMGDAVRKNTRQNQAPRLFPTSARVTGVDDDIDVTPPATGTVSERTKEVPMTDEMRVKLITDMLERVGSMYHLLTPEERHRVLLSTLNPADPMTRMFHTRPNSCMFGGGLVAIILGIVAGLALASNDTSSLFRGSTPALPRHITTQPSATSKRAVDRMLSYA